MRIGELAAVSGAALETMRDYATDRLHLPPARQGAAATSPKRAAHARSDA